jgi:hypothetical protein
MDLLLNIIFSGLIIAGCYMAFQYAHIAIWRLGREKENRKTLSLHAFLYGFGATFSFLLLVVVKEPLAKGFLPLFFVISIIMGVILRDSALSPIRSAEILSKLLSQIQNRTQEKDVKDIFRD